MGLKTRVTLEGKACPKTLIAKFQSPVAENRAVAGLYQLYERAITFYTEIAPTLSIRAPRCFHAGYDPDARAFVLLLEDLDHYILVIRLQATFHPMCTVFPLLCRGNL